ncbi:hypothetical protein FOMPIDRAFT_1052495 [Fomitopsis schrenkii]|uniref:Uncharacterized protein n=1 Tax=Fomitopsis schrenkii TaxID=2126942 RepID=S8FFU8_FOMSC|nr:hypothetical protein FOMPIDRAFT_1052495 [Fomitopsis schrenkii]
MSLTLDELYDLVMYVLNNDQEGNLPGATEIPPSLPTQSDIRTCPSSSREQAEYVPPTLYTLARDVARDGRIESSPASRKRKIDAVDDDTAECFPDSSAHKKMRAYYALPITEAQRPEPVAPETIYDLHICPLPVAGGKTCGHKGSTEDIWAHIRAEHGVPAHADQPEVGACAWGGCTERGLPLDLLKHWQQVHKSAVFQEYRGYMKTKVRCKLCVKQERKGSKPPTLK